MLLWLKRNWKSAFEVVGLAIVILVVVIGARGYWSARANASAKMFYSANRIKDDAGRIAALVKLSEKYSGLPYGKMAMMELGDAYMKKASYAKAEDEFNKLASKSRNHPILYVASLHKLASAYLAAGDSVAAAGAYLKAAAEPHNLLASKSRFRAAQCFELAGKYDDAKRLYKQIMNDGKDFSMKQMSEERLLWLMSGDQVHG